MVTPAPELDTLLYWVKEREQIRLRKAQRLPQEQWTDDPILKQYRFCNVRRRDDRVSQWLIQSVLRETHITNDLPNFLLFSALCRWINWPPTIAELLEAGLWTVKGGLDLKGIIRTIVARTKRGEKAWTGAYMIRAKPGSEQSKAHYVVMEVVYEGLRPVLNGLISCMRGSSARGTWEILNSRLGWGPFMAGQVVADWGETSLLSRAYDRYDWAPVGPGSARGFNRVLGRPLNAPVFEDEWLEKLGEWRRAIIEALIPGERYVTLTAHDVQNCLCEVDKYLRVRNGEGRPRALYKPETAF